MDKSKKARMQEFVELLNKAGRAYYQDAIMSNYEYDRLYDELLNWRRRLAWCCPAARQRMLATKYSRQVSKKAAREAHAVPGQDKGCRRTEKMAGRPESDPVLEAGRSDDRTDL